MKDMDFLPNDPAILVSSVNMLLRDEEFDSLEALCYNFNREPDDVKNYLKENGYIYSRSQKQFRPVGYNDKVVFDKNILEPAYSFMHQKLRIYLHSTLDWQKDDIELAIAAYVDSMNSELYSVISSGREDYLKDHSCFINDITDAVEKLDSMLKK